MTDSQAFTKLLEDFGTNQRAQATLETELRQLDITFNQRGIAALVTYVSITIIMEYLFLYIFSVRN
jgi:hypothetical protein